MERERQETDIAPYILYGFGIVSALGGIAVAILVPEFNAWDRAIAVAFGFAFLIAVLLARLLDKSPQWRREMEEIEKGRE